MFYFRLTHINMCLLFLNINLIELGPSCVFLYFMFALPCNKGTLPDIFADLYSFCIIFITTVLNVFIFIIESGYEVLFLYRTRRLISAFMTSSFFL